MTTQALPYGGFRTFWVSYIAPLYTWVKMLTQGERLLLIAVLCFGAVGSFNTHAFYAPSRGEFVGWMAAIGNELLYLGAAGLAVKLAHQIWISRILMGIGALASAYFGVLVSLRESLPGLFGIHDGVPGGVIVWPTPDQWAVFGSQSVIEGVVPALAALLLAILLHSQASHRLMDADDRQKQIDVRKQMKPFECPFCTYSDDTHSKLWGHFGRCQDANADPRSVEDKRALVRLAVEEGKKRILEG